MQHVCCWRGGADLPFACDALALPVPLHLPHRRVRRCEGQAFWSCRSIAFDVHSAPQRVTATGFNGLPGSAAAGDGTRLLNFAYDLAKSAPGVLHHATCLLVPICLCPERDTLLQLIPDCMSPVGPVQTFPMKGVSGTFDHIRFQVLYLTAFVACV